MFSRVLKFLIFSIIVHFNSCALSLAVEDVIIKSDNLLVNKGEGRAYFTGNVIVWFDDAILKTTKIIIVIREEDKKRTLEKIIFPSKLKAMKESENEMIIADKGEFLIEKNLLSLKGNIHMQKDGRLVKCDELDYFTKIKSIRTTKEI